MKDGIAAVYAKKDSEIIKLPNEVYPEDMTPEEKELRKYILGYSGEGGFVPNLLDINNTWRFKDNSRMEGAAELITFNSVSLDMTSALIEYKGKKYSMPFNSETMMVTGVNEANVYEGANVYISQAYGWKTIIIEKNNTEVYFYLQDTEELVRTSICDIYECDDLKNIKNIPGIDMKGKEIVKVIGDNNVKFSKVIWNPVDAIPIAVYRENGIKGWYTLMTSESDNKISVDLDNEANYYLPMAFNLTDEEKAEIDAIIEKIENPS